MSHRGVDWRNALRRSVLVFRFGLQEITDAFDTVKSRDNDTEPTSEFDLTCHHLRIGLAADDDYTAAPEYIGGHVDTVVVLRGHIVVHELREEQVGATGR